MVGVGTENCNTVFLGGQFLFRHFCYRIRYLATMHSVTDRQTDYSTMPIADHTGQLIKLIKMQQKIVQ